MDLLPAIDILNGHAVRLAKGDYAAVTEYNDNPVEQARAFEDTGATWVHVVDLDGAKSGSPQNIDIIEQIATQTNLHVEIGGGVRSMDTLDRLANAGASRIVLGTVLVRDPDFAAAAVAKYGNLLAAGIDARNGMVSVSGWTEDGGMPAHELVVQMAHLGYTHLIYTDIARDGMQTGIDPQLYVDLATAFENPVIASGGVSGIEDINALAQVAQSIEGVIAGRAVYEGTLDITEALFVCARV